jgi:hypothetical protein
MSAALKRAVRRNIAGLGAVFTLSDKNYKPSSTMGALRFVGAWGGILGLFRHLLGPLVRPSLRIATVMDEPTYRLLAYETSRNLVLDFKSSYCGDQAFNIASSDRWWQYCIDFLIHSTDFIVMDISRVSAGSTWEIVRLVRRESHGRCIFIAHEDYAPVAMDGLDKLLPVGFAPELHLFRESGAFLKPEAFEAAVQRMLAARLAKAAPAEPTDRLMSDASSV